MSVNNLSNECHKIRKEEISILYDKIQNLELKFENVLKKYNINKETLLKKQKQIEERVQCPFNKNHFVTKKNYEKHYKRCELISKHINTKLSLPQPPSSQFFYTNTNVISLLRQDDNDDDKNNKINNENLEICKKHEQNNKFPSYEIQKFKNDKHILCNIKVGLNSNYEIGEKTMQEKLNEHIDDINLSEKIKNEFVEKNNNLQNYDKIIELVEKKKAQMEKIDKSKTQLSIEQRDYKRRRKSYRAKNIKITKRSATQIQKDLIDSFVKDYELYLEIINNIK